MSTPPFPTTLSDYFEQHFPQEQDDDALTNIVDTGEDLHCPPALASELSTHAVDVMCRSADNKIFRMAFPEQPQVEPLRSMREDQNSPTYKAAGQPLDVDRALYNAMKPGTVAYVAPYNPSSRVSTGFSSQMTAVPLTNRALKPLVASVGRVPVPALSAEDDVQPFEFPALNSPVLDTPQLVVHAPPSALHINRDEPPPILNSQELQEEDRPPASPVFQQQPPPLGDDFSVEEELETGTLAEQLQREGSTEEFVPNPSMEVDQQLPLWALNEHCTNENRWTLLWFLDRKQALSPAQLERAKDIAGSLGDSVQMLSSKLDQCDNPMLQIVVNQILSRQLNYSLMVASGFTVSVVPNCAFTLQPLGLDEGGWVQVWVTGNPAQTTYFRINADVGDLLSTLMSCSWITDNCTPPVEDRVITDELIKSFAEAVHAIKQGLSPEVLAWI